jgi:hypothetical protein
MISLIDILKQILLEEKKKEIVVNELPIVSTINHLLTSQELLLDVVKETFGKI